MKYKSLAKKHIIRPTSGKVREALFDILRGKIRNAFFLDLYAGTGAVGIDALQKGASKVFFVEESRRCIEVIKELVHKHHFTDHTEIITRKAIPFIEWADLNRLSFDIIFLDPPYHTDEILNALSAVGTSGILRKDGTVVAEHFTKKQLPAASGSLFHKKDYCYGDTVLSLFEKGDVISD